MQGEERDANSFTEALCIMILVVFGMVGAPRFHLDPASPGSERTYVLKLYREDAAILRR